MPRTLTEAEFNRVKAQVLASAPPNMDEATFTRWAPAQLSAAIAEAELRQPELEGGPLTRFASSAGPYVNPVTMATGLWKSVENAPAVTRTLENILGASQEQYGKAKEAYQQGRYSEMVGHGLAIAPVLGPAAAAAGEQIGRGDIAGGLGSAVGLIGSIVAPGAIARRLPSGRVIPPIAARSPAVQQAVEFGLREGIPVDVATATANPFLRGAQRLSEESILGSTLVSPKARAAQAEALTATGTRLAERTAPGVATTPETAGEAVRAGVVKTGQQRATEARAAYGELRAAEASPLQTEYVPADLPTHVKQRLQAELGEVPTGAEIQELRRIQEELTAVPFQSGKLSRATGAGFEAGETTYSPRAAGAPVYHDILQAAPGTSKLSRGDVQRSIALALKTGRLTNAARGALAVAKARVTTAVGAYSDLSKPILPPEAGQIQTAMRLPVDLGPAKVALRPLYTELMRQKELTGVLQGAKARTLTALDTLMTAGDHAPLSLVDRALSDLKSLSRAEIPELRTAGEGVAGAAVKALDTQVRAAAARAGPQVLDALERGRTATRAKYVARDLLKSLGSSEEGVGIYRKATAPKDAQVGLLRDLQAHAPEAVPQVGRAFLEELLQRATAEGGFTRGQGLLTEWQRLGSETKRVLFRDPALIKDLDDFFLLAKRMAENPNPSGSALTVFKGGELGALGREAFMLAPGVGVGYTLAAPLVAKLLLSPTTTRLLLQGLRLPVNAKAARLAWAAQLQHAISEAKPGLVPAVTDEQEPGAR